MSQSCCDLVDVADDDDNNNSNYLVDDCEVSRVRVMLLMSVAYNFFLFTTRPTILLLVSLPLNSITNTKTVIQ